MKKVLFVSHDDGSLKLGYQAAFEKKNIKFSNFDLEIEFKKTQFTKKKLIIKIFRRFFYNIFNYKLNKNFIKFVIHNNPDIIIVNKGFLLKPGTIKYISKKLKFIIINFNADSPFDKLPSNSSTNIIQSIKYFDAYLIWSNQLKEKIEKKFISQKVFIHNFAYNSIFFERQKLQNPFYEKVDISFIGTFDSKRHKILTNLSKNTHSKISVYGSRWKAKRDQNLIIQNQNLDQSKMYSLFRASKININIFKKQNTNASNMRVYEIMGSRNFLISEYSSLLDDIFVEGKEIEFFREPIELYEKVNFYLKRDDLREKISMNGYYKIKNENYEHRVNEIKKIYDEIRKNY